MLAHEKPSKPFSIPALLSLATGFALAVLVIQWLFASGFAFDLRQGEAARTLLGLVGVGLAIGLIAGILTIASRRWLVHSSIAVSLAFVIAILVFLDT